MEVGTEFVAKRSYPFDGKEIDGVFSFDIKRGERIKILSFLNGSYQLLNLTLGNDNAWVRVSKEELRELM